MKGLNINMKRTDKFVRFLAFSLFLSAFPLYSDVPVSINYTGHIEGANGELDDKVMLMAFRLYDQPGSGLLAEKATALWGRQSSVTLSSGDFDVDLKDTFGTQLADTRFISLADALTEALKDGPRDLYLGLTPVNDANAEIFPRQRLTAIPKVVQARAVRTIPDDFVSTNGTFSMDGTLVVNGASQMKGDVSYGATEFGLQSATAFNGGVAIAGTLAADAVAATKLQADAVAVKTAVTDGTGLLTVTGALAAAGTTLWSGNITGTAGTITADSISGAVLTPQATTVTLTASNLVNRSTTNPIYKHKGTWKLIGGWQTFTDINEIAERHNMRVYDSRRGVLDSFTSISAGTWTAPCDCLALFQTSVYDRKEYEVACVQFYIISDPKFDSFSSVPPNAVSMVSNGKGAKVESVVPLLLRKGQLVKWLGYNNNKADGSTIEEIGQTTVKSITYQPFGWQ